MRYSFSPVQVLTSSQGVVGEFARIVACELILLTFLLTVSAFGALNSLRFNDKKMEPAVGVGPCEA